MHIVLPYVQIAFLKFTSCDNQALSRVYSNCWYSCSFEPEIIKISQSSHKIYSDNIQNFLVSTPTLNACTKKSGTFLNSYVYIYIYIYECVCVFACINGIAKWSWQILIDEIFEREGIIDDKESFMLNVLNVQ